MESILTRLQLVIAFSAALFAGGCQLPNAKLSEKPKRVSSHWEPNTSTESTVSAIVSVPYAPIAKKLDQSVPRQYSFTGRSHGELDSGDLVQKTVMTPVKVTRKITDRIPFLGKLVRKIHKITETIMRPVTSMVSVKVPYDVNYRGTVRRGDISVGKSGNSVRVALPISVEGHVGLAGGGARLLLLHDKNVKGAVKAWADINLDLNDEWGPIVTASPGYSWTSDPKIEAMHGVWISVKNLADDGLKDSLDSIRKDAQKSIPADAVRKPAESVWHRTLVPIAIHGSPNGVFDFIPVKAGFSGIEFTKDSMQFSISISGRTTFYSKAPNLPIEKLSLPKLERIPVGKRNFSIIAPLYLEYSTLEEKLQKALVGKVEKANTSAGLVAISFSKFDVYQTTDGRLSLGIHFTADFESRSALSTRGVVWFTGKPTLDTATQIIALKDTGFSRILDNKLWSLLTAVFSGTITSKIEEAAKLDLKPLIAKAKADAERQVNENSKAPAHLKITEAKLQELGLTDECFGVVVKLDGNARVSINTLK